MSLIECVPNISDGRRTRVIEGIVDAVRAAHDVRILDVSSDASHNRSVLTIAGEPARLRDAVLALYAAAVPVIDLRSHRGEHPRMGAVDVVPFIPLGQSSMAECVELARETASAVADRFHIPVFLYEEAATADSRRNLADIRRGGFEGLPVKLASPDWRPDFGPVTPHPTAGASAIGARMPLVAFNVNLATDHLDVANRIARAVRSSSGGLPHVKALGVSLADRSMVQVSMNLTNYRVTPVKRAFEAVRAEAARDGVAVIESELIGLVPAASLAGCDADEILLARFRPEQILETRL